MSGLHSCGSDVWLSFASLPRGLFTFVADALRVRLRPSLPQVVPATWASRSLREDRPMSRCLSGGSWTPLQQYANSLPAMEEAREWPTILPCVKQGLRGCGSLYLCSLHGDRLGLGVLDEGMGERRRREQEGTVGKCVASASIIWRWWSVGWHFVSCGLASLYARLSTRVCCRFRCTSRCTQSPPKDCSR